MSPGDTRLGATLGQIANELAVRRVEDIGRGLTVVDGHRG
jgi:hypothetical protein